MDILDDLKPNEAFLSDNAMNDIKKTTPWMKFMAILGLIFMGFMTLGILGFMAMGAGIAAATNSGIMLGIGLFFVGYLALQFWILLSLYNWAARLKEFTITNNVMYLERALNKQKIFWMIIGIMTLVVLISYVIMIFTMGSIFSSFLRASKVFH